MEFVSPPKGELVYPADDHHTQKPKSVDLEAPEPIKAENWDHA
jgi:hypothetical protein